MLVFLSIWLALLAVVKCTDVSLFKASSSVTSTIATLQSAAQSTIQKNSSHDFSAAFLTNINGTKYASIYTNWPDVVFFQADMDIDCDGQDWQCPNNPDGQPVTTYGNLSAYNVPYIVVPDSYVSRHKIPQNAISAVICNGQMYYAIMGDTNGNTPQVIGEASWLLGQTCFPTERLDGANGHSKTDVLYIVFMTEFGGVNDTRITDYTALKNMGDEKVQSLVKMLSTSGGVKSTSPSITTSSFWILSLVIGVSIMEL